MNTVIPIPLKPLDAGVGKCSRCKGSVCCTYLTQKISAPRTIEDYDLLLWQIAHRDIQIYKDDDGWFLLVNNPCRHLLPQGHCGIYATRPQVCRDHSTVDCEVDGAAGPEDFAQFFPDYESLEAFCRRKFKRWDRRFDKSEKKKRANRAA